MTAPLLRASLRTTLVCVLILGTAVTRDAHAESYVFGWPFVTADMTPRGGTTTGPAVEPVREATAEFEALQADGLTQFERDRRAILAMAGSYRVSFDFLEIVGFAADFEPASPYRSWATEHVYVVDDSGERIVLQHILIMSFVNEDGETTGPFVTKHWRQDWQWQASAVHTYRGHGTWARTTRDASEREGRWTQTVWQVDDSPRYAAWGAWQHTPERSWWRSEETWRPLPQREFTVRDDYDVLIGHNTHIILPSGWVHEEHNVKTVLDADGTVASRLAREFGLVRYERLRDFDRSAGDAYWQATASFWGQVRAYWQLAMDESERIRLRERVDGRRLFEPLFARAQAIADGEIFDESDNQAFIARTIDSFRADPEQP